MTDIQINTDFETSRGAKLASFCYFFIIKNESIKKVKFGFAKKKIVMQLLQQEISW